LKSLNDFLYYKVVPLQLRVEWEEGSHLAIQALLASIILVVFNITVLCLAIFSVIFEMNSLSLDRFMVLGGIQVVCSFALWLTWKKNYRQMSSWLVLTLHALTLVVIQFNHDTVLSALCMGIFLFPVSNLALSPIQVLISYVSCAVILVWQSPHFLLVPSEVLMMAVIVFFALFLSVLYGAFTTRMVQSMKERETYFKDMLRGHIHDASNPLSVIIGNVSMIENNLDLKSDLSVRERLEKVKTACDVLEGMVSETRKLFLISGMPRKSFNEFGVDLGTCLEKSMTILEHRLKAKNIRPVLESDQKVHYVKGSESAIIAQILTNVLTNSIKFSYPDTELHLNLEEDILFIDLTIKDFGKGMNQDVLDRIFDPDRNISEVGTFGEMGLGYGLPLVSSYMERFGGKIFVESRSQDLHPSDHGTLITLRFVKASPRLKRA